MSDIKYNIIKLDRPSRPGMLQTLWNIGEKMYMVSTANHEWAQETMIFEMIDAETPCYEDLFVTKDLSLSHEECVKAFVNELGANNGS
jgi:hypothetical protein